MWIKCLILLICVGKGYVRASWQRVDIEDVEKDGTTLLLSKLELPVSSGQERNYLRRKFVTSDLFPDFVQHGDNYTLYSNLRHMHYLQVSVNVWNCRKEDSVCKQHIGPISVHLGMNPDDPEPIIYDSTNSTQPEITLHTSFCAYPSNFEWHLSIAAAHSPAISEPVLAAGIDRNSTDGDPPQLLANVRIELKQAHAVGGSSIVVTTPSVVLFGLPIQIRSVR